MRDERPDGGRGARAEHGREDARQGVPDPEDAHLGPGGGGVHRAARHPFERGEIGGAMSGVDDRPAVDSEAHERIGTVLRDAVREARAVDGGAVATYTPRLAAAPPEATSAAVACPDGAVLRAGEWESHRFTLQSASKLLLLVGLLEDLGEEHVFDVVGSEPSGDRYDSLLQLTLYWPRPANPLINAGAIALCGLLEGDREERRSWITDWATRALGAPPTLDEEGIEHELSANHINRAMGHLLKSGEVLRGDVGSALDAYYTLCSVETDVVSAARFAGILARGGTEPDGTRVFHARTVEIAVSLMATCGMYNESGAHLMSVGIAAKSGVSGVIVAVAPGRGGIATASPRLGPLGTSIRGQHVLRRLSEALRWHFAHSDE